MELLTAHLPLAASAAAFGLFLVAVLVRKLNAAGSAPLDWERLQSFSPKLYAPMERLLAEGDFAFLRTQRGYQPEIERGLRRRRRNVFRAYVNRLEADFTQLHKLARVLVVNHQKDSPELVSALIRQAATFRYALLRVRLRLALHALGVSPAALRPADVRPLLDAARWMREQVQAMSPQMSAA
jgi:hypothetical protein